MTVNELCEGIEKIWKEEFPNSMCSAYFSSNLWENIRIKCFLAGDKTENPSNYWDNDMLSFTHSIGLSGLKNRQCAMRGYTKDSEIEHELCIEGQAYSYVISPPKGSYLCYGRTKLSYRKANGNAEKILDNFKKFVVKSKAKMLEDYNNGLISDTHIELFKQKLGL